MTWRRWLGRWLPPGVSALLLLWVMARVELGGVLQALAALHPGWMLLACVLGPLQVAVGAERWRLVSQAVGAPLSRGVAMRELALSTFLNQVLPGGVAGDAVRVWRRREQGLGDALKAAVLDRVAGQVALLGVAVLGSMGWWARGGQPAGLFGALGLLCAAVAVGAWLGPALRVVLSLPGAWGLSLLLVGSFLLGLGLCGLALGVAVGPWLLCVGPLLLLAMAVPLSAGGWGLREVSAAALLPGLGWSPEQAVALSAAYGLSVLVGALPGALVWRMPREA